MPKTEIILTKQVIGLGAESDQVKVSAGYARNYLIPHGLAIPLTGANKRRLEVLQQRRAEREAHDFNSMNDLARSVSKLIAVIKVKAGDDGKLFGSVTPGMIADHLRNEFDIALDRRKIHLEHPLRTLGDHEIELRLHADISTTLKVKIESITPLAVKDGEGAGDQEAAEERRGRRPAGPREKA